MENKIQYTGYKTLYRTAAVCVFTALLVMLAEILITALPDGAREMHNAVDVLEMYNRNWFMGMRYMGLMNIIATSLMIPVHYSLYCIYKKIIKYSFPWRS